MIEAGECSAVANLLARKYAAAEKHSAALKLWGLSSQLEEVSSKGFSEGGDPLAYVYSKKAMESKYETANIGKIEIVWNKMRGSCQRIVTTE